jgi:hypothetical protein
MVMPHAQARLASGNPSLHSRGQSRGQPRSQQEAERLIRQNNRAYIALLRRRAEEDDHLDEHHRRTIALIRQNGQQNMLTFLQQENGEGARLLDCPFVETESQQAYHSQESLNEQLHFEIPTNLENHIEMKRKLAQKASKEPESLTRPCVIRRAKRRALPPPPKKERKPQYYKAWYIPVEHWSKPKLTK